MVWRAPFSDCGACCIRSGTLLCRRSGSLPMFGTFCPQFRMMCSLLLSIFKSESMGDPSLCVPLLLSLGSPLLPTCTFVRSFSFLSGLCARACARTSCLGFVDLVSSLRVFLTRKCVFVCVCLCWCGDVDQGFEDSAALWTYSWCFQNGRAPGEHPWTREQRDS